MKGLLKLFKICLFVVLGAAILALLTGLAWWFNWPLATGAVVLVGVLACWLFFLGVRTLWRWRNKRLFVKNVLQEQQRLETRPREATGTALMDIWQQGMAVLDNSPLRYTTHPRHGQPWFLALDDTGRRSDLFRELGRSVPPHRDNAPLTWHFLPSSVVLQVPEAAPADADAWESTLTLLARDRRKMALRGIVLLLSAQELLAGTPDVLRAKGQRLRGRLQQVMLTLSRRFPVYVCVQDMESLPGMRELGARLPVAVTDAPLGCLIEAELSSFQAVTRAAEEAVTRLREAIRDTAADVPPHGDELLALEAPVRVGEALQVLLEPAFRLVPHQATPLLRGVFFCHTEPLETPTFLFDPGTTVSMERSAAASAAPRPRFLVELFSQLIPGDPVSVRAVNSRFALYSSTKAVLMGAWLALLLFVCGTLAVNTVYQHHVLTNLPVHSEQLTHSALVDELFKRMQLGRYLEHARRTWPLPTFGQNMIALAERKVKADFWQRTYADLLSPILDMTRAALTSGKASRVSPRQMDSLRQLRWLCSIMAGLVDSKHGVDHVDTVFPLTSSTESIWTPLNGEIIVTALSWTTNAEQRSVFAEDLQQLLAYSITQGEDRLLDEMMLNAEPLVAGARICLSQYWQGLVNSDDDVCVPGRFTRVGSAQLADTFEDIWIIADKDPRVQRVLENYSIGYGRKYVEAWYNFINKFNTVWQKSLNGESFVHYSEIRSTRQLPHVLMLRRLSEELSPLLNRPLYTPPAWVNDVVMMEAIVQLAVHMEGESRNAFWDVMLSFVNASPESLQVLRNSTKDAGELRTVLQSVPDVHLYLESMLRILHSSASTAQALTMSAPHFAGGDTGNSPFALAEKQLNGFLNVVPGSTASPARTLMAGLLDFARQGVTVQAARELQHLWEVEVLASPANLYRATDIEAIYGETGVVTKFVADRLKPFVTRSGTDFVAANWKQTSFPFTTDFLRSISHGEAVAASPARSTYAILLRSQPTLVNIEASERPDATTVTLQCPGKTTQLVNRNYPQEQTFDYAVETCGEATVRIAFPSLTLQRVYANFAELVEDFQYGERAFAREDFPESSERLAAMGVNEITVRLLPDNAAEVLQRKNNSAPVPQDRITYVW